MAEKERITLGTVIKLALACLLVGMVLAFLNVTPQDVLERAGSAVRGLWEALQGALGWAGSYMLLGALVVLPIWLVRHLWRRMSGGES